MDWARTRARRPAEPTEVQALAEQPAPTDTFGSAVEGMSTRWAMDQILALPQTEAEAVLLRAVVGLDATSAAKVLGKRPGAVRVAAHRGLKRLARTLRDDEGPGDGHV
jgi:RNA polymerase sigma-70 factor (ECF subfamily)